MLQSTHLKFDKMLKSKTANKINSNNIIVPLYQARIQDFERVGLIVCKYSGCTLIANGL